MGMGAAENEKLQECKTLPEIHTTRWAVSFTPVS